MTIPVTQTNPQSHRWISAVGPNILDVPDLARQTEAMVRGMPYRDYDVFVPCAAPFKKPSTPTGPVVWLDGASAAKWLQTNLPTKETRRHSGGFLLTVECHDPWAAVEAARMIIARADARVRVSQPGSASIKLDGWARISQDKRAYKVRPAQRQVEIGSLFRQNAVYRFNGGLPTDTDDALELASYMESPSDGAAIAGGWAAIEALLIRPGEGSHHLAADRLAALVTCSLPRAETTHLAYEHIKQSSHTDPLAISLQAAPTNRGKVELVTRHLGDGNRLSLTNTSDLAAEARILAILSDPGKTLNRIHTYITESLRRLYTQRNTIAHSGSFRSIALNATTRTAFSLVGAGLDRIVHAQLDSDGQLRPQDLVARAEIELKLAASGASRSLGSLLD